MSICKNEQCGAEFPAADARPPATHLCPKCRRAELKSVARENIDQLREWVNELLSAGAKLPELFGIMIFTGTGLKCECAVVKRNDDSLVDFARFPFVRKALDTEPGDGRIVVYVQRDADALILRVPIASKEK
jgi:hypothetical protein